MITLDPTVPQHVQYCIPLWLRNEQIKLAIERRLPKIEAIQKEARGDEPIAIVCFGPSLLDTWEKIKDFKYVMTCSGSHKFLVEKGIIPTHHVEVDPRIHKIELLGQPKAGVEYLIASTCHPKYFDHLAGFNVKLWHVFSNEEDAFQILPRGEWAITGGSNVGLRAMTIARFLGFTNQHIFGMDGNARESSHTIFHPNAPKKYADCVYDGVTYKTTPGMVETARQTTHELDMMHDVKATFYGEGLVQAMMRNYIPKPQKGTMIGINPPELISAEYRALNQKLHKDNLAYGVGGGKHAETVKKLMASMPGATVLDYGCGKGYLAKQLGVPIWEYDPAIPGKEESPKAADIVCCFDVLEHVEEEKIIFVLHDLQRVTKQIGYFIIHTGPSSKVLADGRNAHILQRDKDWWKPRLKKFFQVAKITQVGPLLHVVVAPKAKARSANQTPASSVPPIQGPPSV